MLASLLIWVQSTAPVAPTAPSAPAPLEELAAAAQALAAAPNYRFEFIARVKRTALAAEPAQPMEPAEPAAPAEPVAPADDPSARERSDAAFTIAYEAGQPLHFVGVTREFFRSDERFAIPHPRSGKWFAIDREHGDLSQAPRGRGEIAQMLEQADAVVLPHELLADLAAKVSDVQVEEKNGERLFTATLTDAGLAPWCRGLEELDRGGKVTAKPATDPPRVSARRGTLTVIVSSGVVREASARITLPIGKTRAAFEISRACHLTDHGTTTVSVPAEVRSALQLD